MEFLERMIVTTHLKRTVHSKTTSIKLKNCESLVLRGCFKNKITLSHIK